MEDLLGVGEVDVEHFLTVSFGGRRDGAVMKNGVGTNGERLGSNGLAELSGVDVVRNLAVDQVAEFGAVSEVVHNDDVRQPMVVQLFHEVRADETGATGYDDHLGIVVKLFAVRRARVEKLRINLVEFPDGELTGCE